MLNLITCNKANYEKKLFSYINNVSMNNKKRSEIVRKLTSYTKEIEVQQTSGLTFRKLKVLLHAISQTRTTSSTILSKQNVGNLYMRTTALVHYCIAQSPAGEP